MNADERGSESAIRNPQSAILYGEIQAHEIFEAGTHRGRDWSEADLDRIAINFEKHPEIKPPVVLGHDEKQELLAQSGLPSGGLVQKVWRSGRKLLADIADVPRVLVDCIGRKAYRRTSAELYLDFNGDGPALRRVALLGADIPVIKTLADVAALYSEPAGETVVVDREVGVRRSEVGTGQSAIAAFGELADRLDEMNARERPHRIIDMFASAAHNAAGMPPGPNAERTGKAIVLGLVDELKALLAEEQFSESGDEAMTDEERKLIADLQKGVADLTSQQATFSETLKAKDLEIVELKKAQGHAATVEKVAKVDRAVARFSESGQYLPAWTAAGMKGILLSLSDDAGDVAKFAEGEKAPDETPLDGMLRILSGFPKLVKFGETAKQGETTETGRGGAAQGEDFMAVAEKRSREDHVSFAEGAARVAKDNPDLHKAYVEKMAEAR